MFGFSKKKPAAGAAGAGGPPVSLAMRETLFGDLPPDLAQRLGGALPAMLGGPQTRAAPITLQTAYDPVLRRLKLVVIGDPGDAAAVLKSAVFLLEQWR